MIAILIGFLLEFFRLVIDLLELNEEKSKVNITNLMIDLFLLILFGVLI